MMVHVNSRRVQTLLLVSLVVLAVVLTAVYVNRSRTVWPEVAPPQPQLSRQLRASCRLLLRPHADLPPVEREGLAWACSRVGVLLPWPRDYGCGREVTYAPAVDGALEQNLLRYAALYGMMRLMRADVFVDPAALTSLRDVFPSLTLSPRLAPPPTESWQSIGFWPALELVRCRPGKVLGAGEPQRYIVEGPPDGSAVHLFHPFEESLRRELRLSSVLRRRADDVLRQARGSRTSITYIGLLLTPPDSRHRLLPPNYLRSSMSYYRRRYLDTLFVVMSPGRDGADPALVLSEADDVVLLNANVTADPALSLAVRAACNHSIVTADEGFWGAYMAGGEVTMPPPEHSDIQGFGWLMLNSQMAGDERWTIVT